MAQSLVRKFLGVWKVWVWLLHSGGWEVCQLGRHLVPELLDHGRFVGSVMEGSLAGTVSGTRTPRHRKVYWVERHIIPERLGMVGCQP